MYQIQSQKVLVTRSVLTKDNELQELTDFLQSAFSIVIISASLLISNFQTIDSYSLEIL